MSEHLDYVLGLDLGASSVGWAVLGLDDTGEPAEILRSGVHLFEAGIDGGKADPETALMQGREQSKSKPRRDARAMRRQTWRRARRKKKVLGALIRHGLLPEGDIRTPAAIDAYVKGLDADLRSRWEQDGCGHRERQMLPYRLRAAAVERALRPEEFGRALYHLAQRRGFLSNRKTPMRQDEDESAMKQAIGELEAAIARHDPPTLGAYLASLDPDEERLRGRWTSRRMYLDEFDRMWEMQADALGLSEEARQEIHDAIFWQRPLKDQRHLLGRCSLVPGATRCPIADRLAQRFRVLQQVNHLRITMDDGSTRPLTDDERGALLTVLLDDPAQLDSRGDLTFAKARKLLGLPSRGPGAVLFNLERGGEKRLIGHRTDATLAKIFGNRWQEMSEGQRDAVVHDVRSVRLPETLERIGRQRWHLSSEAAEALASVHLEEGYSAHSRRALARLVPLMEDGLTYSEARKREFPESFAASEPRDLLPPLDQWDGDLRNPSVARALTELRKVVNAVVRRYGKPARIHIELARELGKSKGRRQAISKRMRQREKERADAAAAIVRELGIAQPKRWQIEKWLLAEECGWQCPFTGRRISPRSLLGTNPQFDVEHIWPYSRSLDNSFLNKTLCYHEENRARKRGHTPHEAYAGTPEQYAEILRRVDAFRGDRFAVQEKKRRFREDIDEDFSNRHLSETQYISRLACDYLSLLYGGRSEDVGEERSRQRIVTPSGTLTAWLRRGWGLDGVLSEHDVKERADHRHHAIDAIVIALADQGAIQRVAQAARRMEEQGRERPFDAIEEPWAGFVDSVRESIEAVVVSYRQSRKVRGKLHEDTLYSKEFSGKRRVRKELWKLTKTEVQSGKIVDKRALRLIREKLAELGSDNPAKAFQDRSNCPLIRGHDGRMVPLRHVRVEVKDNHLRLGQGERERFAASASNHHMAFYDRPMPGGGIKRMAQVVSLAEAYGRLRRREPIVDRTDQGAYKFAFSLSPGEYVFFDAKPEWGLCRVLSISDNDIECVRHTDGRRSTDRKKDERVRLKKKAIEQGGFRKVHVNYLGEVHDAGG